MQLVSNLGKPRVERASVGVLLEPQMDSISEERLGTKEDIAVSGDAQVPSLSGALNANIVRPRWEKVVWIYGR
ncbi:unnamed protein product [Toxocara canis]|nr:unnamed protein product [Toxocara canis]